MPTPEEYREAASRIERLAELEEEEQQVKDDAERLGVNFDEVRASLDTGFVLSELEEINKLSNDLGINLTEARKKLGNFPDTYVVKEQTIPDLIKSLRNARRQLKGDDRDRMSKAIDSMIDAYSDHLDKCIDSIHWLSPYKTAFLKMRYSTRKTLKN